jgi:hypothetical protein
MLLKPRSKLKQYNMSYGKGRSLIRPWGDILPDGTMVPWRDNDGNFGLSWFVQDDICQAWGKDFKFTAMARCEDEQNWPTGSPLQLLYDEVRSAPKFKPLLERLNGSWPTIGAPRHCGLLKGLIIEFNGKSHAQRPVWGAMIVMAPSAREAFEELLNVPAAGDTPAEASADDPYGWNTKYHVGDPIGLQCGKIFEFDKESKINGASPDDINLDGGGRGGKEDGGPIEKYAVRIFPGKKVLPLQGQLDKVRANNETFEDALWFMTGEEQINNLIIRGFGHSHRDLVLYVFGNKGLLPQSYETAKVTVDMSKKTAPSRSAAQESGDLDVNLDAGGDGGECPPWDDSEKAEEPVRSAAGPVFTPPVQPAQMPGIAQVPGNAPGAAPVTIPAVSAGGTADSIRARLAAAKAQAKA